MSGRNVIAAMATAATIAALVIVASYGAEPPSSGHMVEISASPLSPSFVSSPDDHVPPGTPGAQEARELLRTLPRAEPRLDQKPYQRELFGPDWADPDKNGCNGREDALGGWAGIDRARGACASSGSFRDPYTGRWLTVPMGIDVDHVVPLKEAWRAGADRWSAGKRLAFANDPGHLIPVSIAANRSKGDKTPDRWMPTDPTYWCEYARVYIAAKSAYSLTVTAPEAHALGVGLDTCAPSAVTAS